MYKDSYVLFTLFLLHIMVDIQNYHVCRSVTIYYIGIDVKKNQIVSVYITELYLLLVHLVQVLMKLAHPLSQI